MYFQDKNLTTISYNSLFIFKNKNDNEIKLFKSNKIEKNLDKYETNIYNNIKNKLIHSNCSRMWGNQREFLNGIVRKFKPKKILEIGVAEGGSSIVILNAIKTIKNSHLYSIDISKHEKIGFCVKNIFPNLLENWSLYTGNSAAKFIEEIGNGIDMVFLDSSHFEPGEILDFLIVFPFLKKGAIVAIHDIGNQITRFGKRQEFAPYLIFNIIRGKKYLPSGKGILYKDIGAIKLEDNQQKYINDYFRALGGQWQYFPEEEDINLIRNLFKKYYNNDCFTIFEEASSFNRKFVKRFPVKTNARYKFDSNSLSYFKNFI